MGDVRRQMESNSESSARAASRHDADAAKGRSNIQEFIGLMREHSVPPATIYEEKVQHREESRGFGPWAVTSLISKTQYSVAGQGWMLQDCGYDRSHLGYYFIIPNRGITRVHHTAMPVSSNFSGHKTLQRAQFARGAQVTPARWTKVIKTTVAPAEINQNAFNQGGTKLIYQLSGMEPFDSDAAFSLWASKSYVEILAQTAQSVLSGGRR